jgi:signal peptidase I
MENQNGDINIYDEGNNEEAYFGVGSFIWEVIKVFFWALIIIIPIRVFLFQPFFVQGASMEPNFENGDYLIVNELGHKQTSIGIPGFNVIPSMHLFTVNSFKELARGDVVVFRYPLKREQFFIKRIIGLPGEKVKIEDGVITIFNSQHPDGFVLDEDKYLSKSLVTTGTINVALDDQNYFVLGDNRQASHDSRAWGPLPKSDMIGKVLIRAWPITKAGIL